MAETLAGCLAAKTTVSGAMMWRAEALAEDIKTPYRRASVRRQASFSEPVTVCPRAGPAFLFLFKHLRGSSVRVEYVLVEAVKGFLYSRERKCEVDT